MIGISVSNWPFSLKFLAPASLAVLAMLSMGGYAVHTLDKQVTTTSSVVDTSNKTTEDIVNVDFMGSSLLASTISDVQALNGKFYEILTRESAHLNKDGAGDLLTLKGDAQKIVQSLKTYNEKFAAPEQKDRVNDLIKQIDANFIGKNNDGIFNVSSEMIAIDISLIFQGIQNYQATYNNVITTIKAISDENFKNSLENAQTMSKSAGEQSVKMKDDAAAARKDFIMILVLMSCAIAIFGYIVSKLTVVSIRKIATATDALANGNTDVDVVALERKDELKSIVLSLQIFKENTMLIRSMEAEQTLAQEKSVRERKAAMESLAQNFDERTSGIIQALAESARKMQETAEMVDDSSKRTSKSSQIVALSVAEADTSVQTASHASNELSLSSREISQQITHVAEKSNRTTESAEGTSRKVAELNTLADSIGEIVGSIRGIAEQTNLLALNATIEAARAGDAGKGFAVVADEVKKLASETTTQTEEINDQVNKIQGAVRETVNAVNQIIQDIRTIDNATTTVAGAVEEQNAATSEIGRNVMQISEETARVSEAIREVIETSEVSTRAAGAVLDSSRELSKISKSLEDEVTAFLSEIRHSAQ